MNSTEQTRHQRVAINRADALFERRTINEIRTIERATEKQIEEKKTELRELVGNSYKEVIQSSDAILQMTNQAQSIVCQLNQIRQILIKEATPSRQSILERGLESEFQLIGSRVKYLVDSQEVIWTDLDSKEFLEASRRLLRAQIVHELLQGDESLLKWFPFLHHCWKAIEQLRNPIIERVQQEMLNSFHIDATTTTTTTTVKEVESCLCALATLEKQSSHELLTAFLQFRKLSILNLSNQASKDSIHCLTQTGRLVQDTFIQALSFFSTQDPTQEECIIQELAREDGIGFSGLLFSSETEKPEEIQWQNRLNLIHENLKPLTVNYLSSCFQNWFVEVSEVVHESGESLLISCVSLKSLFLLEQEVKEALKKDQERWEEDIESKLGVEFNIWKTIFEPILQKKCLQLVETSFLSSCNKLLSNLDMNLAKLSTIDLEPLGAVSTTHWSVACGVHEEFYSKLPWLDLKGKHSGVTRSFSSKLVKEFDQNLNALLEEVLELLSCSEIERNEGEDSPSKASMKQGGSVRSFSLISGSRAHATFTQRTVRSVELEPKIQSIWERTALSLAHELKNRISELHSDKEIGLKIEEALLIGTVSLGLAENCVSLNILSGPTDEWHTEFFPESTRGSTIAPTSVRWKQKETDQSLRSLSNAFRNSAFCGIQLWADWVTKGLSMSWKTSIVPERLTGNEHQGKVVISHQMETESRDEMEFMIPIAPSEATVEILRQASLELQRLGSFSSHSRVLHFYQFLLEQEFRSQLIELLESLPNEENSDQKLDIYVLQLLLDFRFVCDVCSTGEPLPVFEVEQSQDSALRLLSVPEDTISLHDATTQKQDPEVQKAVQDSRKKSKSLELKLSSLLDPIDWATYEPHLWKAEGRYYKRTSILFGTLVTTNKDLHSELDVKLPAGTETNSLNAANVISRLPYLPVRSFVVDPVKAHRNATAQGTKITKLEALEIEDDPEGKFSFGELGVSSRSRSGHNQNVSSHQAAQDSTEKLQTGSFTSLGTIFTDKAAEMSALAQQRIEQFGDYLQPSGTSIFSSFTKGVSRTNQ